MKILKRKTRGGHIVTPTGPKKARVWNPLQLFLVGLIVMAFLASMAIPAVSASSPSVASGFNAPGNVLITDQFNNRVIEVNHDGQIVWSYGSGDPNDNIIGPGHVIAPNWAERVAGGLTLIAGTGTSLVPDNRVLLVDQAGKILWQYGQGGVAGSGPNQLNVPTAAIQLRNFNILITDQANNRIIEVNLFKKIVWQYGPTSGPGALNSPNSAELLTNSHILIADEGNNRAIEIDRAGRIIWQYSEGVNLAAFASRLLNGNTLITDSGNARILEVNKNGGFVSQYFTNTDLNSNPNPLPSNAVRLKSGNTIIADQFNHRVFIIDRNSAIVWQYGMTNIAGNTAGLLNAPYSAFVIGDYTGQTVPPTNQLPLIFFEILRLFHG